MSINILLSFSTNL